MIKLKELKKKLAKPQPTADQFKERLVYPKTYQPSQPVWQLEETKRPQPREAKRLKPGRRYFHWLGFSALVIFLLLVAILFWYGFTSFDQDKVELKISGPERVVSGEEIAYTLTYHNQTRLKLEKVKVAFHYPAGAQPLDSGAMTNDLVKEIVLPDLAPGEQGEIRFPLKLFGAKGEAKQAWAQLDYQAGILSSRFSQRAEFESVIFVVPLVLNFDLPTKLVKGQSFTFSLSYLNQSETPFDHLRIQMEFPQGFKLKTVEPAPLEGQTWSIGYLMPNEQGRIFFEGTIEGEEGQVKPFRAQIGLVQEEKFILYAEAVDSVEISRAPLIISQQVNRQDNYIARAGDQLNYQIKYQNTSDVGIREVVITAQLEGEAIDFSSLKFEKASYDGVRQLITWQAGTLADLAYLGPGQQGEVSFSVKVKDPLPINSYLDKNFSIVSRVNIFSDKAPLPLDRIQLGSQSELVTKIATRLTLRTKGYYYDDLIPNSGPLPPRVGQKTTYTIKWQLINTSNDLEDLQVETFLPPHIQWLDEVRPVSASVSYNPQTGQLVWQVGSLPAGTGLILPVKQLAFQIGLTPAKVHQGSLVELIGQAKALGQDTFTQSEVSSVSRPLDTDLPDDLRVDPQQGIVVE